MSVILSERADAIIKSQGLRPATGGMVVNVEWGNFWSSHLPRTSYDTNLDADSPNPNDQVDKAVVMFQDMHSKGILPNVVTYTTVIDALCKENRLKCALGHFKEMKFHGLKPNVLTYASLIDGHFKHDQIDEAEAMFKRVRA